MRIGSVPTGMFRCLPISMGMAKLTLIYFAEVRAIVIGSTAELGR
jgi:hypothetical protein